MPQHTVTTGRGALTDPRTVTVLLVVALLAAVASRTSVPVVLAMAGLAGFSLSGSP